MRSIKQQLWDSIVCELSSHLDDHVKEQLGTKAKRSLATQLISRSIHMIPHCSAQLRDDYAI